MTMGDFEVQDDEAPSQVPEQGYTNDVPDEAPSQVSWEEICGRMKLDNRMELLLRLFQAKFNISSGIEAFTQIPSFLGDYMVREFDYKHFCITLGSIDEASADDNALWTAHLSKNLTEDLVAASTLMLRLAMTIAKANGLEASDWQDINDACSDAVRSLPACYRLQRALPGALSIARAWRHLPNGPEDAFDAHAGGDPWLSDESRIRFEETYNFSWARVVAITENDDQNIVGVCSGRFQVVEATEVEEITLVSLEALHIGTAPSGFPISATATGDVVLCEVEGALGNLLKVGFRLETDFYELSSKTCFISGLMCVAPAWGP